MTEDPIGAEYWLLPEPRAYAAVDNPSFLSEVMDFYHCFIPAWDPSRRDFPFLLAWRCIKARHRFLADIDTILLASHQAECSSHMEPVAQSPTPS